MPLYPVILAGGSGARLWPLSRQNRPKQFLDPLEQGQSLLQSAVECARVCTGREPLLIANQYHRFELSHQLNAINLSNENILLEPASKNTAASVLIAALEVCERNPQGHLLVLPADHYLPDLAAFKACLSVYDENNAQSLHLIGIAPSFASTQYGYICLAEQTANHTYNVERFVEKPCAEAASALLASGDCCWNSGVIVAPARLIVTLFEQHMPDMYFQVKAAFSERSDFYGFSLLSDGFLGVQDISFDHAILERVCNLKVIKYHGQWDDLGNWKQVLERRESQALSQVMVNSGKLALVVGLDDVVVVDDDDVLVVAHKDSIHELSNAAKLLQRHGRVDLLSRLDTYRPWGSFKVVASGEGYLVKHLKVHAQCQISLQSHGSRIEHWVVVKGVGSIELQGYCKELGVGDSARIGIDQQHRLKNNQMSELEIIEVQVGQFLSETDIVRYDDDY